MRTITVEAMAKINLGLDVLRRREDGYHEVKMVMQTIRLQDTLLFREREEPGIVLQVDRKEVPADGSNLIFKAAKLLYETERIEKGVEITLTKRIPVAAGMAGGSTDAAATLAGLNRLFNLGLSDEKLQYLGVKIGADVPYCIVGGTVLSEGIGEKLTPLPSVPEAFLVIAKPDIQVSTKEVYENLQADSLKQHPDIDGMICAIRQKDLRGITSKMENVLETVTEKKYPVISRLKEKMREKGALQSLMSGSGPTVFGIFSEREKAEMARRTIEESGLAAQCFLTVFAPKAQFVTKEED